jgi:hypothetical protein
VRHHLYYRVCLELKFLESHFLYFVLTRKCRIGSRARDLYSNLFEDNEDLV